MRRNVEIKARLRDRAAAVAVLRGLGARDEGLEEQEDRFFGAARGRLKLRRSSRDGTALLAYQRSDAAELRLSRYERVPIAAADAPALARALEAALPAAGFVRKERHLWFVDNIRVHLDRVEGLGEFVELEAIVDARHPEDACHAAATRLLLRLGVRAEDAVAVAYVDLLGAPGRGAGPAR